LCANRRVSKTDTMALIDLANPTRFLAFADRALP
jgi:hypothetical protein